MIDDAALHALGRQLELDLTLGRKHWFDVLVNLSTTDVSHPDADRSCRLVDQ
jgi:hypothetical protein